jgi:hypothetical protein
MSLNLDVIETPYQAFCRKMPKQGAIIVDEKSDEVYYSENDGRRVK